MTPSRPMPAKSLLLIGAIVLAGAIFVLADDRSQALAANTLWLAVGTCAISLPVGTAIALLLVKTDVPGRKAAIALLAVMLLVPLYLQAAAWQAGFGLQGWVTMATQSQAVPGSTLAAPILEGWRAVIWIHAMAAVPWVVLIVGAGLRSVEPELEEEALLSATPAGVFCRVTLRRAMAAMTIAGLWVAATTAAEMTVTDLFKIRTFAEEVYTALNLGGWVDGQAPASWFSVTMTVLMVVIAGVACSAMIPQMATLTVRKPWQWKLGRGRIAAATTLWSTLLIVAGLPLGNLVYKAGIEVTQTPEGRLRHWSPGKCLEMVWQSPGDHPDEFRWSLLIAFCAASSALVIAVLLSWWAQRNRRAALLVLGVTALALAIPGPLLGLGLIELLNQPDVPLMVFLYDDTIAGPWMAQTIKALPLAVLILWHAFATLSPDVLQSAESEGAGWLGRLFFIAIPSRAVALLVAWLVAFVIAIGELAATVLVVPPGMEVLSVRIFTLLHYGVEDHVASICLALVILTTVLGITVLSLARWIGGSRNSQ